MIDVIKNFLTDYWYFIVIFLIAIGYFDAEMRYRRIADEYKNYRCNHKIFKYLDAAAADKVKASYKSNVDLMATKAYLNSRYGMAASYGKLAVYADTDSIKEGESND